MTDARTNERCRQGWHDDPDNSGMCIRCAIILDPEPDEDPNAYRLSRGWSPMPAALTEDVRTQALWRESYARGDQQRIIELETQLAEAERQRRLRDAFLEREGYRYCDIPACNCGSWHQHTDKSAERERASLVALVERIAAEMLEFRVTASTRWSMTRMEKTLKQWEEDLSRVGGHS